MFGQSLRFDISKSIPLLTTRSIPLRVIIEELLWFLRGETDAKILQNKNVHIWDGNTSRQFLDSRGLDYDEGVAGPIYGHQMRHFSAEYNPESTDIGGFDQLKYVENLLKTDPFSRRIVMSYWNPNQFDQMCLLPCHTHVQFYVEVDPNDLEVPWLSCVFYMRSNDFALANNFNVISYTVLTYILALKCNMKPKEIIFSGGDCHVYKDHIGALGEQFRRERRPSPVLILDNSIKEKDYKDISFKDFDLVGGQCLPGH